LLGLNRQNDAMDVLVKQVQAQPSDSGSMELLARLYTRENDWAKLLEVAQRLRQLAPNNINYGLMVVEAGFRSGNVAAARAASDQLLKADASPSTVRSVLTLWRDYWPSQQRIADARALGANANELQSRLAYASFLSQFGSPSDAVRLSESAATLPINASNAEANAVLADAWTRLGNDGAAKSRFDAVLAFDPGNASALRGRAELELKLHQAQAAIVDAQKLTTVLPTSADDRLLLARSYAAAGNQSWVNRTLWSAFQDIPADEKLFAALEATKKGDPDATRELQDEFDRQRDSKLGRGMI
jgi:Tfp pilus assembly protein PilF